ADQKDLASQARARLTVMSSEGGRTETRARLLLDGAPSQVRRTSADGRWLACQDPGTSGLAIRDLVSGEQRIIKKGKYKWEGTDSSLVSPDGGRVAFFWWQWEAKEGAKVGYSFRIMGADGTGERVLFD